MTEAPAFMRPACCRDWSMMAFTSGFGDAFRLPRRNQPVNGAPPPGCGE